MKGSESQVYSGRCACGRLTYRVEGPPVVVVQCHCDECRRISGTGHSVGAMFRFSDFVVYGKVSEFKYSSRNGNEVTKGFCPSCGSAVFGTNTGSQGYVTLSLGTMNDASGLTVQAVVFARDRQSWDRLGDEVAIFETQPEWHPDT